MLVDGILGYPKFKPLCITTKTDKWQAEVNCNSHFIHPVYTTHITYTHVQYTHMTCK
jgi:hypothetical protein